jgi:hypothetical protein
VKRFLLAAVAVFVLVGNVVGAGAASAHADTIPNQFRGKWIDVEDGGVKINVTMTADSIQFGDPTPSLHLGRPCQFVHVTPINDIGTEYAVSWHCSDVSVPGVEIKSTFQLMNIKGRTLLVTVGTDIPSVTGIYERKK